MKQINCFINKMEYLLTFHLEVFLEDLYGFNIHFTYKLAGVYMIYSRKVE